MHDQRLPGNEQEHCLCEEGVERAISAYDRLLLRGFESKEQSQVFRIVVQTAFNLQTGQGSGISNVRLQRVFDRCKRMHLLAAIHATAIVCTCERNGPKDRVAMRTHFFDEDGTSYPQHHSPKPSPHANRPPTRSPGHEPIKADALLAGACLLAREARASFVYGRRINRHPNRRARFRPEQPPR